MCVVWPIWLCAADHAGAEAAQQLEQTQNSLNLQVAQAVREIDALRESQRKASTYRHDLRHHLQYISACIENGPCRSRAGVHPQRVRRDRSQQGERLL